MDTLMYGIAMHTPQVLEPSVTPEFPLCPIPRLCALTLAPLALQEDRSFLRNHDLSVRAAMAVKLRLGEKEILERAVKSAAANREYFRQQAAAGAALPRYEESGAGLLEGGLADSRPPPLLLRGLEEQAAAENGLVNGQNSIPNGTGLEREAPGPEQSRRAPGAARGPSSDRAAHAGD
ncbi:actin-histidine N-methyltransferase-like [Pteropus medius]|uniref:actin-histidine N-methyltransferase-like n=1 Tax=Pteropus vampyrus TaxID=132908 RepID=UPI00196ABF99|nr:actin-histidine N-methyltransferase-like [Pteropus giganteus]